MIKVALFFCTSEIEIIGIETEMRDTTYEYQLQVTFNRQIGKRSHFLWEIGEEWIFLPKIVNI